MANLRLADHVFTFNYVSLKIRVNNTYYETFADKNNIEIDNLVFKSVMTQTSIISIV